MSSDGDAVVAQLADELPDHPPALDVDPGGRLVEERHLGPADQRQGERQPLLLAARQPPPRRRRAPGRGRPVRAARGVGGRWVVRRRTAAAPRAAGCPGGRRRSGASPRSAAAAPVRRRRGRAEHPHASRRRAAGSPRGSRPSSSCRRRSGPSSTTVSPGPDRERHAVDGGDVAVAHHEVRYLDGAHRGDVTEPSEVGPNRRTTVARHARRAPDPRRTRRRPRRPRPPRRPVARRRSSTGSSTSTPAPRVARRATRRDPGPDQGALQVVGQAKRDGDDAKAEAAQTRAATSAPTRRPSTPSTTSSPPSSATRCCASPTCPSPDAPDGAGEADNVVLRTHGCASRVLRRAPAGPPLGHRRRARHPRHRARREDQRLDVHDVPRLAAPASSGRCVQLSLDRNADAYEEIRPPTLVRTDTMVSTGHLPKFADDAYHVERDDLWAIPTAEVPLTSLHRDEILDAADLPLRYCAYTSCFRREAGSAGRDTRGLLRRPRVRQGRAARRGRRPPSRPSPARRTSSPAASRCSSTSGSRTGSSTSAPATSADSAARTWDIEAYAPGCDQWLEVSSVSWFADYQARRANIRWRSGDGGKGTEICHTVNGSAMGWPRTVAAYLRPTAGADGTIAVVDVLRPYLGGATELTTSLTRSERRTRTRRSCRRPARRRPTGRQTVRRSGVLDHGCSWTVAGPAVGAAASCRGPRCEPSRRSRRCAARSAARRARWRSSRSRWCTAPPGRGVPRRATTTGDR